MPRIREVLQTQRWDDYRYYHQSRINQTLHLISAAIFLCAYVLIFTDPGLAGLVGWLAMLTRQTGHFFFEPNGYDTINRVTNAHKEAIKVGYNQKRKTVLLIVWASSPLALYVDPTFRGVFAPAASSTELANHVGLIWICVAVGGVMFRMAQLAVGESAQTALIWALKVLTDPFHNIALYYRSPLALLHGELIDTTIAPADSAEAVSA